MAVDITEGKDGGLLKEIIKEGVGEHVPGHASHVTVHYTGTLLDGTKFDSSKDRDQPFSFDLGMNQVIKGWDVGIATMKKGEIAILTCAPDYAYGKMGSPPKIPPDSTLKFEVEMIDWIGEDLSPEKNKGILKSILKAGSKYEKPKEGAVVEVQLVGKYKDEVFEDRSLTFTLGEGEADGVIQGVEIALGNFKKGEVSKLDIKSKYAFGAEGKTEFKIPPNVDVEYIVTLKNFEKGVETWSLDGEKKLEQAKLLKERGTKYFKNEKYNLALKLYKKVLEFLEFENDFKEGLMDERNALMLSSYLNLALCYLKTNQSLEAKESCNKALELSPDNEKALFRRGQAHINLASPEIAIKDFQAVMKIEPKNTAAAKQVIVCNNLIKKDLAKEKKLYANMFEKLAKENKQREEEELLSTQSDVMHGTLGEWGQEERPGGRDATAFEKENPDILMLNANGNGEFKNM